MNFPPPAAALLSALCGLLLAVAPAAANGWQALDSCRLLENPGNDGDSFHVKKDGKEYIFRLLYVDCPERKDLGLTQRTTEQARYFKILKRDLYPLAEQAAAFTTKALGRPFRIQTCWEDARGDSHLPRFYAVVTTEGGDDLATLLVRAGLARIHGRPVSAPGGRSGAEAVAALEKEEAAARAAARGAWAFQKEKK
ncbi:MAG: thermonuclease family protein [Candidatus Methylacidiphilales bacterium]|nr:thermonuclease family protein [Candidatus Methylacidiphilales bacterium]